MTRPASRNGCGTGVRSERAQSGRVQDNTGKVWQKILAVMQAGVTAAAQRDQILVGIIAGVAAESCVVHFKIGYRAARFASPAIPA